MKEKRTKNCIYFVFCALFFVSCSIPFLSMLLFGAATPAANETLAALPKIVRGGKFNADVLSDTAAYFSDRFPLRRQFITANSALHMSLLGESPVEKVIAGDDGWLFYADTLADFTGESRMTEREVFCAARSLYLVQEYANRVDAEFVFTAAPNKNSLFPEKMPKNHIRSTEKSNVERLYAELERQDVAYCDLHSELAGVDGTYHKTDSHWNGYGSALAHDALMQTLSRSERLADEAFTDKAFAGDLFEMLCPSSEKREMSLALARERAFCYASPIRAADDMLIETLCKTGSGTLLMFRDSFGNAWHEDIAERFASARFSRAMPYDLTMLDGADTLVIELVERNLPQLAQKAPILPAPVRVCHAEKTADQAEVTVKMTENDSIDGCVRYTGVVIWEQMDTDSPIYVELDGTVYEAIPHADGGFTLYAPRAEEPHMMACSGGIWYSLN